MNASSFRYGQLLPGSTAAAREHNEPLLGPDTLGIEVTEAALAALCGLGNIDPQHDHSGSERSAIEAALECRLPPPGALLVTIRADLDALGAMAVLAIRAEGRTITPPMRARIAEAGRVDRFAWGPWPGPRPMPRHADEVLAEAGGHDMGVLSASMRDHRKPLTERVGVVRAWLLSGTIPPIYLAAPQERAAALWKAISEGRVAIGETIPGRLAEVVSEFDGALQLGYRVAPVVVALNPRFKFPDGSTGRKYTIAQYKIGSVDLERVAAALSGREPGWGGSATIIGSPQGRFSDIELPDVSSAVVAALA